MALSPTPNSSSSSEPILVSHQLENHPNSNSNQIQKRKKWKKKSKKNEINSSNQLIEGSNQLDLVIHSSSSSSTPFRKRNKSPGYRVVHGRIYDSENGKTCHQCRQKTLDLVVTCKNMKNDKPCPIMFCHKCLLNRYGEKAEETNQLDDWNCPRCRGVCNCSFCMKKRGHQPTGILVHAAKATGFGSVLEMLAVQGPENVSFSLKKNRHKLLEMSSIEDSGVEGRNEDGTHHKKRLKKDGLMREIDLNIALYEGVDVYNKGSNGAELPKLKLNTLKKLARANGSVDLIHDGAKSKKRVKKAPLCSGIGLNATGNGAEKTNKMVGGVEMASKIRGNLKKMARDKSHINMWRDSAKSLENYNAEHSKNSQICIYQENSAEFFGNEELFSERPQPLPVCSWNSRKDNLADVSQPLCSYTLKIEPNDNISVPPGNNLATVADIELPVADIELPAEDVRQFLEFCNAFGEELLLKERPVAAAQVTESNPVVPLQMLASWCNLVHMIS